jgi:membrane protein
VPRAAELVDLAKQTFAEFSRHQGQWLAAGIAYFTMFAIAPLIIVTVEIAGFILGAHQALLHQLYGYLSRHAGQSAAHGIESIVSATFSQRRAGVIGEIIGWCVLVLAAVGLFSAVQQALDTLWDVAPQKRSLLQNLLSRLHSFAMMLAVALILLFSIGLNALATLALALGPSALASASFVVGIADFVISLVLLTAGFALCYKYLPDCRVAWRDVGIGATISAVLFLIGQRLLGWYLATAGISSTYGTFGGLFVFLLWVYYSSQILLIGAQFTQVYSKKFGSARSS